MNSVRRVLTENNLDLDLKFEKSKNQENIDHPLFVAYSDECGSITPSTIDNKTTM